MPEVGREGDQTVEEARSGGRASLIRQHARLFGNQATPAEVAGIVRAISPMLFAHLRLRVLFGCVDTP